MLEIKYIKGEQRVKALYDDKEIGECTYQVEGDIWVADHTFVEPVYRNLKIAEQLVEELVTQARQAGVKIRPVCRYVVNRLNRMEKYNDILAK